MKEGWEIKKLGEVIVKTETINPKNNPLDSFRYVDVSSVNNNTYCIDNYTTIIGKDAPSRARKLIKENDILFATVRPTLKRIAIVPDDLNEQVCSTGYIVLRVSKEILTKFLYYFLQTDDFIDAMRSKEKGASYPAVTDNDVKSCFIPVASLSEQQRIVTILDTAFAKIDAMRSNAEKNLQSAKDLFQAALKQELSPKEGWQKCSLLEVTEDIFAGGDVPKDNYSDVKTDKYHIPIFANAVKNKGLYGYTDYARVTKPSITIAARGSGTGYTVVREGGYLPIVRLIVVVPNSNIVSLQYLYYAIRNLEIIGGGSAIPQLTVPMIKDYIIDFPDLDTQHKITAKLEAIDKYKDKLEKNYQQTIEHCQALKQAILTKAFNGEL